MNNTPDTISPEKLEELKTNSTEVLSIIRQWILTHHPFIGSIAMRLNLVPVRDKRVRTAQTDGRTVYFDIDFLSKLSKDEQIFVLSHEVWHVVMMHMLRLQNRQPELFNIATDKEVNYLLKNDGLIPPENLLFPNSKEEGKSAEEIYEMLLKDYNKNMKNGQNQQNEQDGNNGKGNGSGGSGKNNKSKDKVNDKLSGQFDEHKYDIDTEDANGEGTVKDQWGEVGYDPDYNPAISPGLADEIRESVVSAAQQVERRQGTLPDHIKRIVEGYLTPEISWKEVLAQFVTSSFKNGETRWVPPSRRHVYRDLYLPSRKEDVINVTVAIDTSGSTSQDLPKFFSELVSLLDSFGHYKINLIQCDAAVDYHEEFDSYDNPFDPDIKKFEFTGGGGTSFEPVFEYVYENSIEPNCLIYFTDGYGTAPKFPPNYPVLWILTHDGAKDFCDWGRKINFKNRD